jgi:hypothetical protein
MAMSYSIDPTVRTASISRDAMPAHEEWERPMLDILAHPDFRPGFSILVDVRGHLAPPTDYVKRQVAFVAAPRDELGFPMRRAMLGVRREVVTVAAGNVQSARLIETGRGRIRIRDRTALERTACECYGRAKEEYERVFTV